MEDPSTPTLPINTHLHRVWSPWCLPHSPHKPGLITVAAGYHVDGPLLSPSALGVCTFRRKHRAWINWWQRAAECDYSGLVCKVAKGLCPIPIPCVALCLGHIQETHAGLPWLKRTEWPVPHWAALQTAAATQSHCTQPLGVITSIRLS